MKRLILTYIVMVHFVITFVRAGDTTRVYDVSKKLFIEVLPLIDGYNHSCVHIGVEWPVNKEGISVHGVWGHYLFSEEDVRSGNYGTFLKAGIKASGKQLYTRSVSGDSSVYFSVNGFYKSQCITVHDNIRENYKPGKPVTYIVTKESYGAHIEIGNVYAFKHILFETYFGLGVRCSTVESTATDSLKGLLYHLNEGFVDRIGNAPKYKAILPSMNLGVRLGYVFKRRKR